MEKVLDEKTAQLIDRCWAECALAAREKGLSGLTATQAVVRATAKLATKLTGKPFTEDEIRTFRQNRR